MTDSEYPTAVTGEVVYLGIDPGAKGGVAYIEENFRHYDAWRFPGDFNSVAKLLRHIGSCFHIKLASIEKVHAMPKQGVTSTCTFCQNFGAWQGALCMGFIPYVLARPNQWQKELLDSGSKNTKERSMSMARRMFPLVDLSYKADDGKADALHLARWSMKLTGKTDIYHNQDSDKKMKRLSL